MRALEQLVPELTNFMKGMFSQEKPLHPSFTFCRCYSEQSFYSIVLYKRLCPLGFT